MRNNRLKIYGLTAREDLADQRWVSAGRDRSPAEFTPGRPPHRILWCRTKSGSPGGTPDERYFADEVLPAGIDVGGHVAWAAVDGGLQNIVVHNLAEAAAETHLLEEGTVLRVEERLDGSAPPEMVYLAYAEPPRLIAPRLARIEGYSVGAYTVQPVRKEAGGFVEDGDPIGGVVNLGELQADEAGYLAGPEGLDRYVQILETPAGWVFVLHPPRML